MGKARTFSNEGEDANYLKESEDEIYNSTQQNSYNLGSTTFSDQSGIGNFAQSGTDQRKADLTGALFRGNIGFLLQSAVLDDTTNTINLLEDQSGVDVSDVSSDRIVIISGIATTADLEIILGAQRPGQRLVLYNTDGNTITIKDASTAASPTDPNLIRTPGALDYIITGFDSVQLVFDSIEEQWRIVGAVGTGGGTGYNLIQDEGISLTQRTTMNFIGNAVTAVDNPGQSRTDITINTGSGTIPDGTAENQHLEWDNSFLTWNAVDALTFGTTGPFAASGFLRTANDEIIFASRNAGDSDDIRLKINASDRFIFEFPGSVVPLEIASNLIDVKTVDIVNIDRAKFVISSGSMVPNSDTGILLNSNNQFQFNTSDTSDFTFTFDNNDPSFVIDRLTASSDSTLVSVLSDETDINSQSFLNITKSFSIPLSLQEIGSLNFIAGNSVGSTLFEYASIIGKIENTSAGSIDGSMILNATVNDSVTPFIILNNASNGIIQALKNFDMNNNNIENVGNMDFGTGSATSGRIRLPAGGAGAIKWESVPAGFDGEMYFDNDFNWFVDTGGEYKYFIGGFERFRIDDDIECFSDIDMNNNDVKGVQAIGFNDAGGQINVDLNVFQFVTTSPSAPFRFTPQGTNILDIDDQGLEMQSGDIRMGNGNISGLNELQFNTSGQVIRDGVSALTIEVGSGDTIDFIVNSVPGFQVNQSFCEFFDSFWDMTERGGPIFAPPVAQRRVFVNPLTEELSVIRPDSVIVSLETGGGGATDRIVALTGDALAIVQASTFQVFTQSVERFNINPSGLITLISSGEINMIGNVNMNDNKIFDVSEIEFETAENITLDDDKVLITSQLKFPVGNTGETMIFNVPSNGFNNDRYEFYLGTFPNNPALIVGRNRFRYQTVGTLSGSTFDVSTETLTLQVGGVPGVAQIRFVGPIGTNIIPLFGTNLNLGNPNGASEFWDFLAVRNITFSPNQLVNIVGGGNTLTLECGLALQGGINFNRSALGGGGQFFRCTDDGNVFTPKDQVIFTAESIFNNDVTFNEDVVLGSSNSDKITINGVVSGDYIPDVDNTFDLGSGAKRLAFIHGVSGVFSTVNASVVLTLDTGIFFLVGSCSMNIDTVVGTKIGTGTNQKIGFWNKTPVVQQTVASDTLANLYTALRNNGIIG